MMNTAPHSLLPTLLFPPLRQQRGAALVLSMILLMVLTLLGLTSMRTATMEEKMAGNMRDRNLAFEAAESALREGEAWVGRQTSENALLTSGFSYSSNEVNFDNITDASWWTSNTAASYGSLAEGSDPLPSVSTQPQFVIEERTFVPDSLVKGFNPTAGNHLYRVIARGTGSTAAAQSLTESTFAKRFN